MAGGEPAKTTITIKSTSACCRGKIIQIKIDDEHKKEFNELIEQFVKKLDTEKENNNISYI
jgi:hypothetical protein